MNKKSLSRFINWQVTNKNHIKHIFSIILNDMENMELIITDKKKLYEDIVIYLYHSSI